MPLTDWLYRRYNRNSVIFVVNMDDYEGIITEVIGCNNFFVDLRILKPCTRIMATTTVMMLITATTAIMILAPTTMMMTVMATMAPTVMMMMIMTAPPKSSRNWKWSTWRRNSWWRLGGKSGAEGSSDLPSIATLAKPSKPRFTLLAKWRQL